MKYFYLILLSITCCWAEINSSKGGLNSDPNVIYVEDITPETLKFRVTEARPVFFDRLGKRRVGTMKVGSICELVGFDQRVFKIKGTANHGRVTGWISPLGLECKDPDFVANFKELYAREVLVKELIANNEIAIGMTMHEVERVMGKPTKTSLRRTAKGTSGMYEYIVYEEIKHYNLLTDPETGQTFRNYTHTTEEVKERIGVEFADNAVSAIEKEEDFSVENRGPRIVTAPLYLDWGHYFIR